jgi:hypothetical protein
MTKPNYTRGRPYASKDYDAARAYVIDAVARFHHNVTEDNSDMVSALRQVAYDLEQQNGQGPTGCAS